PNYGVDAVRDAVTRRGRATAEPIPGVGVAAPAESLGRLGAALGGSRRPGAGRVGPIVLLPGAGLEQRVVRLRSDDVAGTAAVPARLQSSDDGRHPAQALRRALARWDGGPFVVLHRPADAASDRQGLPHVSPRPSAVGTGASLQRPDDALLPQHPPAVCARDQHRLSEWHQSAEFIRDSAAVVYLHGTIHLPDAEPGGAQVLGARSVAAAA